MKSIAAFLVLALIWFSGLLAFAGRVQGSTPNPAPTNAQGIVARTFQDQVGRAAWVVGAAQQSAHGCAEGLERAILKVAHGTAEGLDVLPRVGQARHGARPVEVLAGAAADVFQ